MDIGFPICGLYSNVPPTVTHLQHKTITYSQMCELMNVQIVFFQEYPIIAHTSQFFSIQFFHQTADSFGLNIKWCDKHGWGGIFCERDTRRVISN